MCDDTLKCTIIGEHIRFKESTQISNLEHSVDHIKFLSAANFSKDSMRTTLISKFQNYHGQTTLKKWNYGIIIIICDVLLLNKSGHQARFTFYPCYLTLNFYD
jgi:hypothetical protein